MMRLDKYLSQTGTATRTESTKAVRRGAVFVNGIAAARADMKIDENTAVVVYCGETVAYRRFTYVMLNKPQDCISATEDSRGVMTVLDLLPDELRRQSPFPCGRLDRDTTGLLILTNDGDTAHRLLSPKYHAKKTYRFTCDHPLSQEDIDKLTRGVYIGEGITTAPAEIDGDTITITEGKFHQIKRMWEAVDNSITSLERITFAGVPLDPSLPRGSWRFCTPEEVMLLTESAPKD